MSPPQDIVEVILNDHRMMEDLLRLMRSIEADRQAAPNDFAHPIIAHGQAGETSVHPVLMSFEDADTVDHIEAARRETLKVLLDLLEVREIGSVEWDWRLKQLASVTARHIDEEERTLINRDGREPEPPVPGGTRSRLRHHGTLAYGAP